MSKLLILEKNNGLPNGWTYSYLNELVSKESDSLLRGPFGSTIKKEFYISKGYKVYEQKNAIKKDFSLGNYYLNKKKFKELKRYELRPGDIIMTCAGTIGKFATAPQNIEPGIINSALLKIRLNQLIVSKKYFLYLMQSDIVQTNIISGARGSAMNNLKSVKSLKEIPLPLPPLKEQKRIISKIDELFSLINKNSSLVEKIKNQIIMYRKSILENAFDGNLTHVWRSKNFQNLENAKDLIERIKIMNNTKITSVSNIHLPEKWALTTIGTLFKVKPGSTPSRRKPEYWGGIIPWISSGEVKNCEIYSSKEKITSKGLNNSSAIVHPPETILLGMIGEGKTRGQAAILKIPSATNQNIAAILTSNSEILPRYLFWWLLKRYDETRKAGSGGMQPALNSERVRNLPFVVAPVKEQEIIISLLEKNMTHIANFEKLIKYLENQLQILKKTILKLAFQGKLVPQDPNDEPAEILIQKIKQEKEQLIQKEKPKRRKKNVK